MRKLKSIILSFRKSATVIFLIILGHLIVTAQQPDKITLQNQKQQIERDIEYTNDLLEETRKGKKNSLNELAILERKIKMREDLIQTITDEILFIDEQISIDNFEIQRLTSELDALKDEYAKMIYFAFKNRKIYDKLMFMFSSKDFNQAYQRLKYLQQYSIYRRTQGELIARAQAEIAFRIAQLEVQKKEKEDLLVEKEVEKQNIVLARQEKNDMVQSLNLKESELKKSLKEKERAATQLQKAIEAIIAEEIRRAAEVAREKGITAPAEALALTPEERLISDNFIANQGKLPWPVERGIVINTFGEHPHPVLNGVKVRNNGIDIITNAGSYARAIFEGEVTRVISVPNYFTVVIIRHGEYLSVYSNLDGVTVLKGDVVKTKQSIGLIHTDNEKAKTELHFELWKGKILQNPLDWIAEPK
ncbi:MAG: peptidoglycan DD-metalloendopeptidase family protein [Bacteroidetes bacterium]|nr:peptidoglycan DD-metalloendopeptidase family protein [Bacteroidota bacterium]